MAMAVRGRAVTRVLLIEVRHPGLVRAARKAGLQVHYLGARADAPDWVTYGADAVTLLDDASAESMLAAAKDIQADEPFGVAVSMNDTYAQVAADINQMLGLPGNSPEVPRAVNDKSRMRAILRDSPAAPVAAALVSTAEEVRRFAAEVGYPLVLKPVDGVGSRGVTLVTSEDALDDAVASTVDTSDEANGWVAEEYLSGPEFSVETFSADGVHHILAVTEKFKGPRFIEIGHVVPARLPDETVRALTAEVTRCLDAIALLEGPAHTEVILTDRGPRIVETHCRPGGDGIVELVRLALGLDVHRLTFEWLAGRPLQLSPAHVPQAAATWFLTPGPGKVTDVRGLAEARMADGVTETYVTVAQGDSIGELRSSSDRAGDVFATGDTVGQALRRAQAAAAHIEITF